MRPVNGNEPRDVVRGRDRVDAKELAMKRSSYIANMAFALCLYTLGAYAEDGRTHKSFTTEDGKTVDVVRGVRHNDEGDVVAARAYRVTDAEGDVIAAGRDRAYRTDEGDKGISQRRMRTNEEGDKVGRGRQVRTDGEGNVRARRARRVTDENGDRVRARRDRAARNSDGGSLDPTQVATADRRPSAGPGGRNNRSPVDQQPGRAVSGDQGIPCR